MRRGFVAPRRRPSTRRKRASHTPRGRRADRPPQRSGEPHTDRIFTWTPLRLPQGGQQWVRGLARKKDRRRTEERKRAGMSSLLCCVSGRMSWCADAAMDRGLRAGVKLIRTRAGSIGDESLPDVLGCPHGWRVRRSRTSSSEEERANGRARSSSTSHGPRGGAATPFHRRTPTHCANPATAAGASSCAHEPTE